MAHALPSSLASDLGLNQSFGDSAKEDVFDRITLILQSPFFDDLHCERVFDAAGIAQFCQTHHPSNATWSARLRDKRWTAKSAVSCIPSLCGPQCRELCKNPMALRSLVIKSLASKIMPIMGSRLVSAQAQG
jgi:hypothetical protein